MASLEEYLRGAPATGRQASEYDKLVKSLQTYGSTQSTAQALGIQPETNAAPGVLDFLLSPESGVLTAPGRFVRTTVAGPEAAAGFGAVGGLKVQPDDSFLEQAGKLAGAFALDVATDPISYIGAPTSIGRAAVSKVASSLGGQTLTSLSKASNISEDTLVTFLSNRSRVGQAAALQRSTGVADETVSGLARNLIDEDPRKYAEMELGSILGDALYSRGRRGVISDLANVASRAGADPDTAAKAARQVFSELPSEVRGGLQFLNPITGKQYARLAPAGTAGVLDATGLGAIADLANRARLATTRTVGMPATRFLSGKTGPILQGVKAGAKGVTELPEPSLGRPTILDWSNFSKETVKRDRVLEKLEERYLAPVWAALSVGKTISAEFGSENGQAYNDLLFQNMTRSKSTPTPGTPDSVVAEAQLQASNMRSSLNELLAEMNDAGFDVADISPDFFPLMFTPEAAKRFKQTARSGRVSTGYTGAGSRKFGFKVVTDPDEGDEFGFLIEGFGDVYAANPKVAGRLVAERLKAQNFEGVTEDSFITDPIAAMTSYVSVMTQKLSTKRFVDSIVEAGLGVRDVSVTAKRLNDRATSTLASVLGRLSPAARTAATRAQDDARTELADTLADGTNIASRLREARDESETLYRASKEAEMGAAKTSRDARVAVAKARMKAREVVTILRQYSTSGATVDDVAGAQAGAASAQARAARAAVRADETEAALVDLETLGKSLDERYDKVAGKAVDDLKDNALDELLSAEEAALFATTSRQFARTMSAARAEIEGRLGSGVQKSFDALEQAVVRQAGAAEAYAAASTARRLARSNYDKLNASRAAEQTDALNVVVDTYLNARAATKQAVISGADNQTIAALREAEAEAEKTFRRALSNNKRFKDEAAEYARQLESIVDKLTRVEFEAASVFASEDKMRDVVEMIGTRYPSAAEVDAAFTDMVASHTAILGKISKEELDLLSPEQRAVFEAGTKNLLTSPTERSDFGKLLSSNLGNPNAALHPIGGAFEDVYAPLEIKQALDQMFDMTSKPTEWQRKIEDYLDPALLLWRLQVTQLRGPAYTMLNVSGGTFNNMIGGVSLANSFAASRTVANFIKAERQIRKEFPNVLDIANREEVRERLIELVGKAEYDEFEAFLLRGGSSGSATIEQIRQASRLGTEVSDIALTRRGARALSPNQEPTTRAGQFGRSAVDWILTNRGSSFLTDVNQTAEMYMRYAAFKQGVSNFNNYDAAMDLSLALHFDYGDLSQAEKWVRRIVPFYTWIRNNLPLQVRTMFLQPSKVTKFLYARQEIENAYGEDESWMKMLLPEYAQISGGFSVKVGDQNLFLMDRMPYQDLNTTFQVGGFPLRARNIAGSIGPFGGLYGAVAGVDTGTGRAFDPAGTPAPLWARPLAPFLPKNAEGEPLIPEALNAVVQEIVPLYGTAERALAALTGIGPTSETDRRLSSALGLSGVAATLGQTVGTLTPSTGRGELRRRQLILSNQIISAAEEMNVDLDWVRGQIRDGVAPETVLAQINSGAGRRLAGSDQPVTFEADRRQALENMLGEL